MKDELNTYEITNSDGGAKQSFHNEGKVSYDNDKSDYIRESLTTEKGEFSRASETFDDPKASVITEDDSASVDTDLSSSTSSTTASASSTASASASASIGGGLGALTGVVGATVASAAVVVAVFVSALAINLSLVLADMHALTFAVTITGADERDFETPIYAILTGEDTYLEQEVTADTALLTFEGLEPGKEYRLTVKNAEKVFAETTAFTTTGSNVKGELVSYMQGTDVYVTVKDVQLKASEYYTLIGKDAAGNVLYSKDGMDVMAEYTFKVDTPKDIYLYLTVNGKTYAISKIELPDYDFEKGVWSWSDDLSSATVAFPDKRGGDPLILTASVTRKRVEPTCEEEGAYVHTAKALYEGQSYTDKESTVIEAYGHDYEGIYKDGEITYTCSRCGDNYTNED